MGVHVVITFLLHGCPHQGGHAVLACVRLAVVAARVAARHGVRDLHEAIALLLISSHQASGITDVLPDLLLNRRCATCTKSVENQ